MREWNVLFVSLLLPIPVRDRVPEGHSNHVHVPVPREEERKKDVVRWSTRDEEEVGEETKETQDMTDPTPTLLVPSTFLIRTSHGRLLSHKVSSPVGNIFFEMSHRPFSFGKRG